MKRCFGTWALVGCVAVQTVSWAGAVEDEQLYDAVFDGDHVRVVKALEAGANPNLRIQIGDDKKAPEYPLIFFTNQELSHLIFESMVMYGADVNAVSSTGETFLHQSIAPCWRNWSGIRMAEGAQQAYYVKRALELGVDPTLESQWRDGCEFPRIKRSRSGYSALSMAAAVEAIEVIPELLKDGRVNINKIDSSGVTPLFAAVEGKDRYFNGADPNMVQVLLAHGANPSGIVGARLNQQTPLHEAVRVGSPYLVKDLLDAGADMYLKDQQGILPLGKLGYASGGPVVDVFAAHKFDFAGVPGVTSFFQMIAYPNRERYAGSQALDKMIASGVNLNLAFNGNDAVLAQLLLTRKYDWVAYVVGKGANVNVSVGSEDTALSHLLYYSHFPLSVLLIQNGADVQKPDPVKNLRYAVRGGSAETVKALLSHGLSPDVGNGFAIVEAAASKNLPLLQVLMDGHANPRPPEGSPVAEAVDAKWIEGVSKLVAYGADPNKPGRWSQIPLLDAGEENQSPLVTELLKAKDLNANVLDSSGRNILFSYYHPEIQDFRALIAAGSSKDVKVYGELPLHSRVRSQELPYVKALVAAGSDVNTKTDSGKTPVDLARENNDTPMVIYLCSAGASDAYCHP